MYHYIPYLILVPLFCLCVFYVYTQLRKGSMDSSQQDAQPDSQSTSESQQAQTQFRDAA